MPEYVDGDEYVKDNSATAVEEGKLYHRISWVGFVVFAAVTTIYALFGGRGWLALSVFSGISWVVLVMEGIRLKNLFAFGLTEHRLRVIEDRTQRISEEQHSLSRHIAPQRHPPL